MKYMLLRIALMLWIVALGLGSVPISSAQTKSVVVNRRDAVFSIQENNLIDVHETWEVHFIGGPFRSATRTIPLNLVDDIRSWSVRLGDQEFTEDDDDWEYTYTLTESKDERSIKWFFPSVSDQTLTFELSYQLVGALQVYEGGDQLSWTFIEADRDYPIESAQVTVLFPTDLPQYNLFTASYLDNNEAAAPERPDDRTLVYKEGPFNSGKTWSIRVQVPHALFPISEPRWQYLERMQAGFNLIALTLAGVIALAGLLAWLMLWLRARRVQATAVVAEYLAQPPNDIPPAIAGLLLDGQVLSRHIIATLVDLTRRNQLWINRSSQTIEFQRPSSALNALQPFERQIYDHLFGSSLKTSASVYGGMVWRFARWRGYLIDEAIKAGYWKSDPEEFNRVWKRRARITAVVLLIVGLVVYFWYFAQYAPLAFWVVIAATGVALLFGFCLPWIVQRGPKGDDMLVRLQAFKRYLINIKRYTELDKANEQFERYLPYAVAFGLEERWVKTFSEVQTPTPSWFANVTRYSEGLPQAAAASPSYSAPASSSSSKRDNRLFGRIAETESCPSSTPSIFSSASSKQQASLFGKIAASETRSSSSSIPDFSTLSSATFNSLNTLSSDFFLMLNDASRSFSPAEYASAQQSERSYSSDGGFWDWFFNSLSYSNSSSSSSSSRSSSSSSSSWSSSRRSGGGGSSSFD